jgi:8-amino-3,8-dideoxy-alpha-D-manno-octulosonate transaminase
MPGFEIFGDEERKEVQDVLDTGVLFRYGFDQARNGHWKARTFEEELVKRLGVGYCYLCSSGTAALTLALVAGGVGAGDEVVVPPFTFIATIESVLGLGAVPVFAEIDETLCLDPEAVRAAITPRTRAVLPVHMCGSMAQIQLLKQLCAEKGVTLIEDTCQSLGASYKGQALGTFGKAGCFSFDPVKTITCGEGGAVVTQDESVYKRVEQYADHGHDHKGNDRGLEGHPILGTNYRISELNAAVGLAQLRKLDRILETQRSNKRILKEAISGFPEISFREVPDPDGDSATFLSFFLPDEESTREAVRALGQAGVDGCFYWYDNNWHYIRQWDHLKKLEGVAKFPIELLDEVPDYSELSLPQSDRIMGRTISMQIKLNWTKKDLETRIARMNDVFGG